MEYKRIAVKIGSNVLTRKDGRLDVTRMSALVDDIAQLRQLGHEIIMISSGAVASGRGVLHTDHKLDSVSARQLFSAVGQAKLMNRYYELFTEQGLVCGQVLTTKENFGTRQHYLNQKNCMEVMLENGVIPIVNENDTISITELMFTDNDELSGLIATMMDADILIILSNVDGIYNGNPSEPGSHVIRKIMPDSGDLSQYIQTQRSSFGRGGMGTKTNIARKIASEGIPVIIANGKTDNILLNLLSNPDTICTRFLPADKPVSGVKKWIAHSKEFAKGEVFVNEGAKQALLSRASSLLPIGITRISGQFEKDDIIRIMSEDRTLVGLGRAAYNSKEACSLIGIRDARPLVHYDYLYME